MPWLSFLKVEYIFEQLTEGREKIKSYKIKQKRTLFDKKFENSKLEIEEEIFLVMPWRYARKSRYRGKTQLTVYDGSKALRMIGKKWETPKSKAVIPVICGFYLSRDSSDLTAFLSSKNINANRTSMSRVNELVAILFPSVDGNGSGLYVDRESFWPISYNHKNAKTTLGEEQLVEVIFSNYKKIFPKIFFPMKSKRYENGRLLEHVEVGNVEINAEVSNNLFNIANIKRRYKRFDRSMDNEYVDLDYSVQ